MKRIGTFVLGFVLAFGWVAAQQIVDQGKSGTQGGWQTRPHVCRATSPHDGGVVTTSASAVPAVASVLHRAYTTVCNSKQNASGNIKCRVDGQTPVFAAGNPGDYLGNGDCIKYTTANRADAGSPIICISDQAGGVVVTSFECLF